MAEQLKVRWTDGVERLSVTLNRLGEFCVSCGGRGTWGYEDSGGLAVLCGDCGTLYIRSHIRVVSEADADREPWASVALRMIRGVTT